MKKQILITILTTVLFAGQAMAGFKSERFKSGDLWYKTTSDSTVEVTYSKEQYRQLITNGNYQRLITAKIPEVVTYNSVEYAVTSIGDFAFAYCSNLVSITIPNTVTKIEDAVFKESDEMTDIIVENDNPQFSSEDGVLFNKDKTVLIECPKGKKTYTIPEGVTIIGEKAFSNCYKLSSVTIPNSVTNISYDAFRNCYSLTSLFIPNSVIKIGTKAFANVKNVVYFGSDESGLIGDWEELSLNGIVDSEGFVYPDSTKTRLCAYVGNGGNVIIPNSVTYISGCAFANCDSVTSIIIPNSVSSIGDEAFIECDSLRYIIIPNSVTNIGGSAFYNCENLTLYCETENKPNEWYPIWSGIKKVVWNAQFTMIEITATANNAEYGCVSGAGSYPLLDSITVTATIKAFAVNGYHFVRWSDGNTDNPRTIIVTNDIELTAIFEKNESQGEENNQGNSNENQGGNEQGNENQGGENTNPATAVAESAANAINIYAAGKTIVVENATEEIRVYDAMGKLLCRNANTRIRSTINLKTTGVYIVKIGSTVKRVVVN